MPINLRHGLAPDIQSQDLDRDINLGKISFATAGQADEPEMGTRPRRLITHVKYNLLSKYSEYYSFKI